LKLFFLLKKCISTNSKIKIIVSEFSLEESDIDINAQLKIIYDKPVTQLIVNKNDFWLFKIFVNSKILNPYTGCPEVEIYINNIFFTPEQVINDFDKIFNSLKSINDISIEHMDLNGWDYFKDLKIIIKNNG